jgi:hypothetical protein
MNINILSPKNMGSSDKTSQGKNWHFLEDISNDFDYIKVICEQSDHSGRAV